VALLDALKNLLCGYRLNLATDDLAPATVCNGQQAAIVASSCGLRLCNRASAMRARSSIGREMISSSRAFVFIGQTSLFLFGASFDFTLIADRGQRVAGRSERRIGFAPEQLRHVSEFNLKPPDAFQTLTAEEHRANRSD
jgi:hypothetical protein